VHQLRVDTSPTAAAYHTRTKFSLDSATSNYDAVRESFLFARTSDAPSRPTTVFKRRQTDNSTSTVDDKENANDDDAYEEVHSPPNTPISMIT
jgi:hypothetical protein